MLAAALMLSRWIILKAALPSDLAVRGLMAGAYLSALLGAEFLLGLTAMGRSAAEQLAAVQSAPGLVGLGAQLTAAAFCLIKWHRD
jgi:hypothetical protein